MHSYGGLLETKGSKLALSKSTFNAENCICRLSLSISSGFGAAHFLRATAVPAGTAERVLAMAILSVRPSVCLSVCHDPVPIQAKMR